MPLLGIRRNWAIWTQYRIEGSDDNSLSMCKNIKINITDFLSEANEALQALRESKHEGSIVLTVGE